MPVFGTTAQYYHIYFCSETNTGQGISLVITQLGFFLFVFFLQVTFVMQRMHVKFPYIKYIYIFNFTIWNVLSVGIRPSPKSKVEL